MDERELFFLALALFLSYAGALVALSARSITRILLGCFMLRFNFLAIGVTRAWYMRSRLPDREARRTSLERFPHRSGDWSPEKLRELGTSGRERDEAFRVEMVCFPEAAIQE